MNLAMVTYCPLCLKEVWGTCGTEDPSEQALPGAMCICAHCGEFSIFDDMMRLRLPAQAELDGFRAGPSGAMLDRIGQIRAEAAAAGLDFLRYVQVKNDEGRDAEGA